ncbi:peptidase [Alienimonas sp. DA493]|uniref:peptidase n=1 Tax=Alienimonas sp. DA493 TaxID=3373605 RepID=UPI0037542C66
MSDSVSRRTALQTGAAAVAGAALLRAPFVHADDKAGSKSVTVGSGEYVYEWHGNWGELPDGFAWGNTHGVCQSADGTIFVCHQAEGGPKRAVVLAFDPDGKFLRSWGEEFHGGGHGLDLREEGGEEFLYLTDLSQPCTVKFTLKGEEVRRWTKPDADEYGDGQRYMATNVAFTPDGGFFVGDGYGSSHLIKYDAAGELVGVFAEKGGQPGQLNCPHGLLWDDRPGREPALAVADRSNHRISYFDLDGNFLRVEAANTVPSPCDFADVHESGLRVVPDLDAQVTLLDTENQIVAELGGDSAWRKKGVGAIRGMRGAVDKWEDGKFVCPHDAAFVNGGDLLVAEWVPTGRLTYLKRV